jgi:hypothetical protein
MRNIIKTILAGGLLAAALHVSANNATPEVVVVPVGPATITVVEIGTPPSK